MFGRKGREKNELVLFILMKPTNRNKSNKKGKKNLSSAEKFLRRNFFFHHTLSCWKPNFMPWVTVGAPINWGWVLFKGTRSHLIG